MHTPLPDPFHHVPTGAQVSVFAWQGRRERCEGALSRSFGTDHEAAKAYVAKLFGRDDLSKVQVFAGWFEPDGQVPQRRMTCHLNGRMTITERDASGRKLPSRFPDADAFLDLLDAA